MTRENILHCFRFNEACIFETIPEEEITWTKNAQWPIQICGSKRKIYPKNALSYPLNFSWNQILTFPETFLWGNIGR